MTKILHHGQFVRLASWTASYGQVGTVEGITAGYQGNVPAAVERAQANGHDLAFVTYTGSALVDDPSGEWHRMEHERLLCAEVIAEGDLVVIEGRAYTVKVVRGNGGAYPVNSDPIRFAPSRMEG